MKGKRTNIDFSEHIHETKEVKEPFEARLDIFKIPGTIMNSVRFINTQGVMTVTGDFGNWVFCREFHPSKEGRVSDYYWMEKLSIASTQSGEEYDWEATKKEIENKLIEIEDERWAYSPEEYEEHKEYFQELLSLIGDKFSYECYAYREYPNDFDIEYIPSCKKPKNRLLIIFDAFDEICRRLKEKEDELSNN